MNLDNFVPEPFVGGLSSHGGYCGPAVNPIALNMVQSCASDPEVRLPISGIGGISTWRDAAEFIALGLTTVQVCTAVMDYGFRIVEDMIDGLNDYLDSKGFRSLDELRGRAVDTVRRWETLDLNYKRLAEIDYGKCIGCNLCYIACEDGAHQTIALADPAGYGLGPGRVPGKPVPENQGSGMRRLQSLFVSLPGPRLHHNGQRRDRARPARLGRLPERFRHIPDAEVISE